MQIRPLRYRRLSRKHPQTSRELTSACRSPTLPPVSSPRPANRKGFSSWPRALFDDDHASGYVESSADVDPTTTADTSASDELRARAK